MKPRLPRSSSRWRDFINAHPDHPGSLAVMFTSTRRAGHRRHGARGRNAGAARRQARLLHLGEPTSVKQLGDLIKNAGRLLADRHPDGQRRAGHVAYPHMARNPTMKSPRRLPRLAQVEWDRATNIFPTTWQVSNFNAGTGANNVIPAPRACSSISASRPQAPLNRCRRACMASSTSTTCSMTSSGARTDGHS